jgi:arabinan endo-1,5-alpha-L-arabinosidase
VRGLVLSILLLACLPLVLSGATAGVEKAAPRSSPIPHPQPVGIRTIAVASVGEGPVFARDFPDPSVIAADGRYYAFGTQTPWERRDHVFPILVSQDLATWSYVADVFPAAPAWGRGDWWAPAVVARSGEYFLYYSGYSRQGMHCIAVATAASPAGPYTDRGPIACRDGSSAVGYIDAWPLIAGGRAYLYFSVDGPSHHSISVLPLSADMLHVAGPRVELLGVTQGWEKAGHGTVEGPSVFYWASRYVLLYSGGDWRERYGMGYAVATSPLGPFVKSTTPLLAGGGALSGPGGGSFFSDQDGRPWLAYHAWREGGRELYTSLLTISTGTSS